MSAEPAATAALPEPQMSGWASTYQSYGQGDPLVKELIQQKRTNIPNVEVREIHENSPTSVEQKRFTNLDGFIGYLQKPRDNARCVRIITVTSLSGDLLKVLGAYFEMDNELWRARRIPTDREFFAAPLIEKGSKRFSHFHLATVGFFRATPATPARFLKSRKINHTTRLIKLLDSRPQHARGMQQPLMFVIRRLTGHLRRDDNTWTFLYLCDPFEEQKDAHYVEEIPGQTLSSMQDWASECLYGGMDTLHATQLLQDGFGVTTKILRDIKSTWKLALTAMEISLEEMYDNFEDQEFIDAIGYFYRQFLMNIDYFQQVLFYYERYINVLVGEERRRPQEMIYPTTFKLDLVAERDSLRVVMERLNALRQRTSAMLQMILSLNSIKQSEITASQTRIQVQDTKIALQQGKSVWRLTIVNLLFLPPSFIATVFGMNTQQTQGLQIWLFIVVAVGLSLLTMSAVMYFGSSPEDAKIAEPPKDTALIDQSTRGPLGGLLDPLRFATRPWDFELGHLRGSSSR